MLNLHKWRIIFRNWKKSKKINLIYDNRNKRFALKEKVFTNEFIFKENLIIKTSGGEGGSKTEASRNKTDSYYKKKKKNYI
jgi:hypothetical protein